MDRLKTLIGQSRQRVRRWSATSAEARAGFLGKIYDLILERKEPLAQELSLGMGDAIGFARAMQLTALAVNATSIR